MLKVSFALCSLALVAACARAQDPPTTPVTCICTFDYRPLCGSDGHTYPNRCSLDCQNSALKSGQARVKVAHAGQCEKAPLA